VKAAAWSLVVAVVREEACLKDDAVGPVRALATAVEGCEPETSRSIRAAERSEAALIAASKETVDRVVAGVASSATLVSCIDSQIGLREVFERNVTPHLEQSCHFLPQPGPASGADPEPPFRWAG